MSDQESTIRFVLEVEKRETLYNYKLPGYSRKDTTDKAWQEVASSVNMSVAECKEKWRNLRTVFIRKMKTSPNGSSGRKYYLAEAMRFILPYIKSLTPPSTQDNEKQENIEDVEGYKEVVTLQEPCDVWAQPFDFPQSPESPIAVTAELESKPICESPSSSQNKSKTRNKIVPEANLTIAEHFKAKKPRLQSTTEKTFDKNEAIRMFLLSLLPELEEFDDSQIKLFKRRVFNVIDDILTNSTLSHT